MRHYLFVPINSKNYTLSNGSNDPKPRLRLNINENLFTTPTRTNNLTNGSNDPLQK